MQEMDRRVGLLRLSLADIADWERRTKETSTQLRAQLTRIVDFTPHGEREFRRIFL